MRERLTFAFVALSLLLLVGAGTVRSFALQTQLRDHENTYVAWEARTVATVLDERTRDGTPVDRGVLDALTTSDVELSFAAGDGSVTTARGPAFVGTGSQVVVATVAVEGGVLTLSRERDDSVDAFGRDDLTALLGLFALLAVIAGVVGYGVARAMSAPFRQLAQAAAALGRGRFDLDLPSTRVPEARAIAQALESSAAQLQERLTREREFGRHASHVLRTPLTSLTLHLEELVDDPALSPEARAAAVDGLKAVGRLNRVAGELVDLSGGGVLVKDAAQPLRDIATQVAQRWADVLGDRGGRELTAAVEGDIELPFTPGPIEQALDLLLADVVRRDDGAVRVVFEGASSWLRIDVTCTDRHGTRRAALPGVGPEVSAAVAALGGRVEVPEGRDVLRLHLPRR